MVHASWAPTTPHSARGLHAEMLPSGEGFGRLSSVGQDPEEGHVAAKHRPEVLNLLEEGREGGVPRMFF